MHVAVIRAAMDASEGIEGAGNERESRTSAEAPVRRVPAVRHWPPRRRGTAPGAPAWKEGVRDLARIEGPAARVSTVARAIARHIRSRPLTSIAVTVGVGFVVGGALSFRTGRIALGAAARHLARELLKQLL